MNRRTKKLVSQIIIVGEDKIFGPFPDQLTAEDWLEGHRTVMPVKVFSVWPRELGTTELAHECGTLLAEVQA